MRFGKERKKNRGKERNCWSPVLCREKERRKSALIFRVSMLLLEVTYSVVIVAWSVENWVCDDTERGR